MKFIWMLTMILCAGAAGAQPSQTLKQLESSMVVTGAIETHADGRVSSVIVDDPKKFPPDIVALVEGQVSKWRFEPVSIDGVARPVRFPMSARLVAKPLNDNEYAVEIRSASFEDAAPKQDETLTAVEMAPPSYPDAALKSGASGVVYLVLKVGKDGRVSDALVEQVNLKTIGHQSEMQAWRKGMSASALRATRKWTFAPPTKGEQADGEFWLARVPISFYMNKSLEPAYGKWETYIPGVRQRIPWLEEDGPGFSPDGLADGGIYMLGKKGGPKLLTPPAGG
jgi:hypothetical protein